MKVEYVSHMGNDLLVVNAARVSFSKQKEEFGDDDKKLLSYLSRHNHWTPFSHPTICLRVKAPIFVARQLFKHKVGMTENEVSRRYVSDEPEFFYPTDWRGKPTDGAKQGSSSEVINTLRVKMSGEITVSGAVGTLYDHALDLYKEMIDKGIAPEQARMVLPQSMYTEFFWTGSLAAYGRICKLRLDPHAQGETQEITKMISDIIQPLFPNSWEALTGSD